MNNDRPPSRGGRAAPGPPSSVLRLRHAAHWQPPVARRAPSEPGCARAWHIACLWPADCNCPVAGPADYPQGRSRAVWVVPSLKLRSPSPIAGPPAPSLIRAWKGPCQSAGLSVRVALLLSYQRLAMLASMLAIYDHNDYARRAQASSSLHICAAASNVEHEPLAHSNQLTLMLITNVPVDDAARESLHAGHCTAEKPLPTELAGHL